MGVMPLPPPMSKSSPSNDVGTNVPDGGSTSTRSPTRMLSHTQFDP